MENQPISNEIESSQADSIVKKPKFVGGFFGPRPAIVKSGPVKESKGEISNSTEKESISSGTPKPIMNIHQRRAKRKSTSTRNITICPMCGKISTQCNCGYSS